MKNSKNDFARLSCHFAFGCAISLAARAHIFCNQKDQWQTYTKEKKNQNWF